MQEVQEAGKKVAAENVLLRSLLMLHGVMKEEIKDFLRVQKSSIPSAALSTLANSHLMETPNDSPVDSYHLAPTCTYAQLDRGLRELNSIKTKYSPPKSAAKGCTDLSDAASSAEQSAVLDSIVLGNAYQMQQRGGGQDTGQSMSCDDAARIIANMRHDSDNRDVLSELGCSLKTKCMVKNMYIFDMLDT